jgi:FixJ family two-component response regulator
MVGDVVMLLTGVNDGAMMVFISVVGDVPMLVTVVTDGAIADVSKLVNGGTMMVL